jgi:hypothetical protein
MLWAKGAISCLRKKIRLLSEKFGSDSFWFSNNNLGGYGGKEFIGKVKKKI